MPRRRIADRPSMECVSCRADLDATDRYCPACRAPNMRCTRHPRFGPPLRDPGPIVAPRVVPAGSRPCPRCHDGIRPRDTYCRSCGLDVSLLAPLPPSDRTVGVWTTPGPQGLDAYRSLRRPTLVLQSFVVLIALVGLGLAAASLLLWRKLGGGVMPLFSAPSTSVAWSQLHLWAVRMAAVQLGLVVVASLLTVAWTRRAYRNLSGLDVRGKRLPPVWATLGWFVPGANLVVPKAIFDYTWRASDPAPDRGGDWRRRPIPTVNHLWWICTLVALPTVVLALVELSSIDSAPPTRLGDIHDGRAALMLLAVAELLVVFAAALFFRTLGGIAARQARRAERLGPPAALNGLRDVTPDPAGRTPELVTAPAAPAPDPDELFEDDLATWPGAPWPEPEPALAHLGPSDTRSGRY
jgi:Domain of unknown function (DUF4328)/Double zinc ribbon